LQISAYWTALSTTHLPCARSYWGVSQIGLLGSLQAVQFFTVGSGCPPTPSEGWYCQRGGVQ
jgi:hypothetical protein